MRKAFTLAAVMAVAAMVGGPASAGGGPVTKSYVGVIGDLGVLCLIVGDPVPPENRSIGIGGNCFDVTSRYLSVEVDDDVVSGDVGFQVGWFDELGTTRIGEFEPGCNSGLFIAPGPEAIMMKVFIDGPLNGPADCGTALPNGVGILGRITVSEVAT